MLIQLAGSVSSPESTLQGVLVDLVFVEVLDELHVESSHNRLPAGVGQQLRETHTNQLTVRRRRHVDVVVDELHVADLV